MKDSAFLCVINGTVFWITSVKWEKVLDVLEKDLKVLLLIITIGFTVYKWVKAIIKDRKKKRDGC